MWSKTSTYHDKVMVVWVAVGRWTTASEFVQVCQDVKVKRGRMLSSLTQNFVIAAAVVVVIWSHLTHTLLQLHSPCRRHILTCWKASMWVARRATDFSGPTTTPSMFCCILSSASCTTRTRQSWWPQGAKAGFELGPFTNWWLRPR